MPAAAIFLPVQKCRSHGRVIQAGTTDGIRMSQKYNISQREVSVRFSLPKRRQQSKADGVLEKGGPEGIAQSQYPIRFTG